MISLYRAGTSPLHRLAAGPKLFALILVITAISLTGFNPAEASPIGANALAALAALAAIAGPYFLAFGPEGIKLFARQIWQLKWLLVLIIIPQLIFGAQWQAVVANATRLTAAMLAASLFTFTTQTADLIVAIERALGPLKRIGVKPETVGLTFAMTINAIPMIMKFADQTKEAQTARGAKPNAILMTVPLLVASLKYADDFAEALAARGVEV